MSRQRLSASSEQIRNAVDHLVGRCACGPVWKCVAAPLPDETKGTI